MTDKLKDLETWLNTETYTCFPPHGKGSRVETLPGNDSKEVEAAKTQADRKIRIRRNADEVIAQVNSEEWYRPWMDQIITNVFDYHETLADMNITQPMSPTMIAALTLSVLHRIVALNNLVAIQPMDNPCNLLYFMQYSYGDDSQTPASLNVMRTAIQAGARNSQARWNLEVAQDKRSHHERNLEMEMLSVLSKEFADDIIAEWVGRISHVSTFLDYKSNNGPYNLRIMINKACNEIARNTRRGAGNSIIISRETFVQLKTECLEHDSLILSMRAEQRKSPDFKEEDETKFVPSFYLLVDEPTFVLSSLEYVGCLSNGVKVYVYEFQPEKEILVGYKGKSGECDAGLFYCPYHLLMANKVIDPFSYGAVMTMMTRYGTYETKNVSDYYVKFEV